MHYEVLTRDGPARIGKLLLSSEETPLILNKRPQPNEIIDFPSYFTLDGLNGMVIDPRTRNFPQADLYAIARANLLSGDPRDLVQSIVTIRESIPSDVALYAPAISTPENLAMLIYLGVDIVDDILAIIKGHQDIYLTTEGEYRLEHLREFPCVCKVCNSLETEDMRDMEKKERSELVSRHNSLKLKEELSKVKEMIRSSSLREYIEKQCRSSPSLTTSLRLTPKTYLEKRTPIARKSILFANSMEALYRIEVRRFAERVKTRLPLPSSEVLLILPCSARKPYSSSKTHKRIFKALGDDRMKLREAILTSPLGVVPRELELTYPAAHYDIPVTGYWDAEEKNWVKSCLRDFIDEYEYVIAHVNGVPREICETISEEGVEMVFTCVDSPTSEKSLEKLSSITKHIQKEKRSRGDARRDMLRTIADYQFGLGAGYKLVPDESEISNWQIKLNGNLVASLTRYGLLALRYPAVHRLSDLNAYWVKIDDFVPKGSILAPGVLDVDQQIRENDEVIFFGDRAMGTGKAKMSGWEMVESRRGVAVEVRSVHEKH